MSVIQQFRRWKKQRKLHKMPFTVFTTSQSPSHVTCTTPPPVQSIEKLLWSFEQSTKKSRIPYLMLSSVHLTFWRTLSFKLCIKSVRRPSGKLSWLGEYQKKSLFWRQRQSEDSLEKNTRVEIYIRMCIFLLFPCHDASKGICPPYFCLNAVIAHQLDRPCSLTYWWAWLISSSLWCGKKHALTGRLSHMDRST